MRTILGLSGDWTWSAVCGAGLVYLVGRPAEKPTRALGIALIASSMFLHWFWDSLGAITGGAAWAIALYLPLTVANLAIFAASNGTDMTLSERRCGDRELLGAVECSRER